MTTTRTKIRYFLHFHDGGSAMYGDCEVCGMPVREMYAQTAQREIPADQGYPAFWTNLRGSWGHETCLRASREEPDAS